MSDDGLHAEVLGPINAQQHDHEQEQDDYRSGVDDDLNRGQERGVLKDKQHGHAKQGLDQEQGGVHRVAGRQHA